MAALAIGLRIDEAGKRIFMRALPHLILLLTLSLYAQCSALASNGRAPAAERTSNSDVRNPTGFAHLRLAQLSQTQSPSAQITPAYLIGTWETVNLELGQSVRIIWTLWGDGRLLYHFDTAGGLVRGSTGTWTLEGDVVREEWVRPDGTRGAGRGTVEKLDEDTIRLTIIDNGHPEYKGISRVYRRLGEPKLSSVSRSLSR